MGSHITRFNLNPSDCAIHLNPGDCAIESKIFEKRIERYAKPPYSISRQQQITLTQSMEYLIRCGAISRVNMRMTQAFNYRLNSKVKNAMKNNSSALEQMRAFLDAVCEYIKEVAIKRVGNGDPLSDFSETLRRAALDNDLQFITALSRAIKSGAKPEFDVVEMTFLMFWDGFEFLGLAGLPGLKYWTADAAYEAICCILENTNITNPGACYRKRVRLGLVQEEPAAVTSARYRPERGAGLCNLEATPPISQFLVKYTE